VLGLSRFDIETRDGFYPSDIVLYFLHARNIFCGNTEGFALALVSYGT
jgi:hypothetical protein